MAAGVSDGANGRPFNDTIAETGPGISDDAVLEGELGPDDLARGADDMVEGLRRKGWTGQDIAGGAEEEEGEDGEGI